MKSENEGQKSGLELVLVTLNSDQIEKAKEANGQRKKITHGLVCGSFGQIFGTEKHCRKYYSAWSEIFPLIFSNAFETDAYAIASYATTFNLVNDLIAEHDKLQNDLRLGGTNPASYRDKKQPGLFSRLFGKR